MKYLLTLTFFSTLLLPNFTLAQTSTEYTLLQSIPLQESKCVGNEAECKTTAAPYIKGLFNLAIGIAGVLAVVMIIFGGIQYMSTDAFQGKSEAKSRIQNAIWGLILAISAWLILYTINPALVKFKLNIEPQEIRQPTEPSGAIIITPGPSLGQVWQNDTNVRSDLENYGEITINKGNCMKIGDSNCTSVAGLSSNIISSIKTLERNCKCVVTITGGTEYWLHGNRSTEIDLNPTNHKPGGNVVDLSLYTGVSNYLRARGTKTSASGCATGSEKYVLNGATYVNENDAGPAHWHVCF